MGEIRFSSALTSNLLSSSWTLDSPTPLLLELKRNKDTIRCAAPGVEVAGHSQEKATKTWTLRRCRTLILVVQKIGDLDPHGLLYDHPTP